MKGIIFFIASFSFAASLTGQSDQNKDCYAIVETVMLKENAIELFQDPMNDRLIALTDSLRKITTNDSIMNFAPAVTTAMWDQLNRSSIKAWDQKKIFQYKVVSQDIVAELAAMDNHIDQAHMKLANKSVRVHRMSLPLFYPDQQTAIVAVNYKSSTFQDGHKILGEDRTRIYFLRRHKKQWKVSDVLTM